MKVLRMSNKVVQAMREREERRRLAAIPAPVVAPKLKRAKQPEKPKPIKPKRPAPARKTDAAPLVVVAPEIDESEQDDIEESEQDDIEEARDLTPEEEHEALVELAEPEA